jgi:phage terminase small subunit
VLNKRQTVFVYEYIKSGNATAAYKIAYETQSDEVAAVNGSKLLRNAKVKNEILSFKQAMKEKTTVTLERLTEELAKVAFANIQDYLTDDHQIKDFTQIKRSKAAAIASIKTTVTEGKDWSKTSKEFKLHSKLDAIDKLLRIVGGYVTMQDVLDKLTDNQAAELTEKLFKHVNIKPDSDETDRQAS